MERMQDMLPRLRSDPRESDGNYYVTAWYKCTKDLLNDADVGVSVLLPLFPTTNVIDNVL